MDGPSHYREAEQLTVLAEKALANNGFGTHGALIARAQVHATLALAAATAGNSTMDTLADPDWMRAFEGRD